MARRRKTLRLTSKFPFVKFGGSRSSHQKYETFWAKHSSHRGIPDRGYCWSSSGEFAALVCVPTLLLPNGAHSYWPIWQGGVWT
jgi:hypothetical protein